jgi:hypothetical protein
MPRSNRPRRPGRRGGDARPGRGEPLDVERALYGTGRREHAPDGVWLVQPISGAAATKAYRCPGCRQEIPPGVPHLVAWPDESPIGAFGGVQDRRHWHRACWTARTRRR